MSPQAHSPFGGSVAARVLRCPGSVDLISKVPPELHKSSDYADRGTSMHMAMAALIAEDVHVPVESLAGKKFGDYTITHDDIENFLRPAYSFVEKLLDVPGAAYYLDQRVIFPAIANTFGTLDLLIRIDHTVHVIDFKFGVGVRVLALTPDGDDDVLNSQLLFYGAAARHSLPEFFTGIEDIVLTILQPVTTDADSEMVSTVTVTHAELDEFIAAYRVACAEALSEAPRLKAGPWCRFCSARPICKEHTKPLLDLAAFTVPAPWSTTRAFFGTPTAKEEYLKVLAAGLELADAVKDTCTALHDQAKRALENGDNVPGYALSNGRAERYWRDEITAQVALLSLGFEHDDLVEVEVMRSVKQIELRAKARGLKIPPELIISRRSGVSLKRSENVRVPVLGRDELARAFSEALAVFTEEARQ
ncbi:MAG TPA: DUF2800 domain-containing protein [Bradyrhizobium sp.]|jgi:hypothetical protein|nr:DUF2800 domain-containing protein [Bradyrhizobium sp.]